MGMGINSFYTQAQAKDFSRDFSMRVRQIGPGGFLKEEDNVYITTAVLPGYAIHNQAVPFMGLQFNVPGGGHFPGSDSWAVTFRCDAQLNIREKLIGWQKVVFNAFPDGVTDSIGAYGPKGRDSYAALSVFDRDGKTVRGIRLIGVYPVTIGDIQYNATLNGAVVELQATLAYQWWEVDAEAPAVIVP